MGGELGELASFREVVQADFEFASHRRRATHAGLYSLRAN